MVLTGNGEVLGEEGDREEVQDRGVEDGGDDQLHLQLELDVSFLCHAPHLKQKKKIRDVPTPTKRLLG